MYAKVVGDKELKRKLKAMGESAPLATKDAVREGAEIIRQAAEDKAPRRTGELADTMTATPPQGDGQGIVVKVGPHRHSFYGHFQELGTGPGPAQPFLRPALDEKKDEAARKIGDVLGDRIERAGRG